jgi:hypothetical protein
MPTVRVHFINQTREPAFHHVAQVLFERVPQLKELINLSEYPMVSDIGPGAQGVYQVDSVVTFPAFGTSRVELYCHLEL